MCVYPAKLEISIKQYLNDYIPSYFLKYPSMQSRNPSIPDSGLLKLFFDFDEKRLVAKTNVFFSLKSRQ